MTTRDGEIAGDLAVLINRLAVLLTSATQSDIGLPRLIGALTRLDGLRPMFRDELVRLRRTRGITQNQMAERMHTVQSWISNVEADGYSPSWKTLGRYMQALDMEGP